ncbi:MAG: hypothetical protein NC090_07100 [Anaeroplasma bactoclasticum]|nr:hypothetical protein [Anaeroplasma bactoclasticum]
MVHNDCTKINIEVSGEQQAIDYANNLVGPNSKIEKRKGIEFHISEDGLVTWRKDFHGIRGSRSPQTHINVEYHKYSFGSRGLKGKNPIVKDIHIWY